MHNRSTLIKNISALTSGYKDELAFKDQFLDLLKHPRAFHRDHLPGHITGSAWIVDETGKHALLTHHAKLNRWPQPGGHADGDENMINVCTREAVEETGLSSLSLFSENIFDIDIHPIPARKDFPEHLHYDIRLLFTASQVEAFHISDESHDLGWIAFEELPIKTQHNASILRMAEKTKAILNQSAAARKQ